MQIQDYGGELTPEQLQPLFRLHAEFCKVLANHYRLAILYSLQTGEMSVGDLARKIETSAHNVSQHLRVCQKQMLVTSRKQGQSVLYSITNPKFVQGCTLIREALIEQHRDAGEKLLAGDTLDRTNDLVRSR
jgi:DNA-binding transcriptional ArsR family regulator